MISTHRRTSLLVASIVLVTGCERPQPDGATTITAASVESSATSSVPGTGSLVEVTTPSTSAAPDSTVPTSTAPASTTPATTAPATTRTAPPTTTAPDPSAPGDLVLTFDSIGPLAFGGADTDVVPALVGVLGEPVSDASTEYPTDDEGVFVNEAIGEAFTSPFGRTVCFANDLCVQFGAGSATALQFVGWRFEGDDAAGLANEDGITVGSLWADHLDQIERASGGCFTVGAGAAGGIDLTLQSSGEPFVSTTADGGFEDGNPDPADVSVVAMMAGDLPLLLAADC